MGCDAASSCTSSGITATLQGTAVTNTDRQGCVALPARPESPLRSSEFSTSSSSTSETFFTSAGRVFETSTLFESSGGGDTSSAISTSSSKKEPFSAHFDCNGISSDSLNIPSPILEEDLALTMHELEESDGISKDLDLDMKPRLDDVCPSNGRCVSDSGCDGDMLLSRLDKLLNSDGVQEVVDESGFTSMNDLFPDFSCPPDFCVDEMSSFSAVDNFRGLDSSSTSNVGDMPAVSSSAFGSEEESVSEMFAQWLQSNAHWVSLSDLRKIKLKTSTIENATRRLGGGRKGLTLFLKFVLMWVQSLRQGGVAEKNMNCMSPTQHSGMPLSPNLMVGTTAMSMQGSSKRGTFGSTESSDVVLDVQAPAQTPFSGCGSLPTALSTDWNTASAQGAQPMSVHPNVSMPASRGYTAVTNGDAYSSLPSSNGGAYSAFPSTNFYQSNSPWLPHGNNGLHGVCPTSLQPSLQPLAPGTKNRLGVMHCTDASSFNVSTQQRQCPDANPAATFRAARKNRMERQRWSVRRNRKWAASNQQQRLAAVASSNGYGHSNIGSWPSQSLVNGVQKFPYLNSQSRQPSAKGASTTDYQQSKRHERNLKLLFHKELKQSDVGSLGRIVLPKKAAETCLPPLELRDGVNLVVEDIHLTKVWNMRYRFWPNNKSRMYLLENTSDFVKLNDLKEGDYMMMYLDSQSNKYVIRGLKGTGIQPGALSVSNAEVHEGEKQNRSLSKEEASSLASFIPGGANCEDSCEDSLLVDFIEQTLEDF